MGISEVARLAVELVQQFDEGHDSELLQANDEKYNSLKTQPEYGALVIHAAVARSLNMDSINNITQFLDVEPEWVATLLPLKYLQEYGSSIPAFRKQYQRVMAEQTRTMTFDMFNECTLGYAELFQIFRRGTRSVPFHSQWTRALAVIGKYDLEPFKVLSLWISFLPETYCVPFVQWIRTTIWNRHPDWVAILKLSVPVNSPRLAASLVGYGVVDLDTVWGMHTADTNTKFKQFEEKWRTDHSAGPQRLNALAMAMPLIDDDDDDEEDVIMEDDLIPDPSTGQRSENNESADTDSAANDARSDSDIQDDVTAADADPNNFEAVEFLRKFVGYLASILAITSNPELEDTIVQIVNTYPIAFGSAREVSHGFSHLLAARLGDKVSLKDQDQDAEEFNDDVKDEESAAADADASDAAADAAADAADTVVNGEGDVSSDTEHQDIDSLELYWRPIAHAIAEPAWSKLGQCIASVDDEALRFEMFRKYMLASIDLHPRSESILFAFTTRQRYILYTDLATRLSKSNEMVKVRFNEAERNTKDILKRLTKKDAEKIIVPQLLEQFSRCAWPSLNVFVNQVESYNIGTLIAHAAAARSEGNSSSSAFAPLAMDMLPLILMQQFTVGRDTTQKDGLHMSKWLRLLAQFAGDIASEHDKFDFVVIIKLVLHQIASNNFSEIFVMDQIVRKLSGIPLESNLSPVQLLALNSAPLISEVVQCKISEQPLPQLDRLLQKLRNDEAGDLITIIVAALSYAYTESCSESDAKVVASKQDAITNLMLIFRHFDLDPSLDRELINKKFAANIRIGPQEEKSTNFESLLLYDVAIEPRIYTAAQQLLEEKAVDRALIGHKFRVKSVKQKLSSEPLPDVNTLLSRILLSPSDALFTSRYLQAVAATKDGLHFLSRGVLLAVLNGATPLETESYATFVVDLLTAVYIANSGSDGIENSIAAAELQDTLAVFANAILEAAIPDAPFTVLNNVFNLLQRTLQVFPVYASDGNKLIRRIQLLTTTTEGDLETAVKSLNPQLLQRKKFWCTQAEVSPEFVAQLKLHNDRLYTRFAAGMKTRE